MQAEFNLRQKGAPGRRRTITAKAWISRRGKGDPFKSNVYIGSGRVHTLSTGTMLRSQALEFSRSHLISALTRTATPKPFSAKQECLEL